MPVSFSGQSLKENLDVLPVLQQAVKRCSELWSGFRASQVICND